MSKARPAERSATSGSPVTAQPPVTTPPAGESLRRRNVTGQLHLVVGSLLIVAIAFMVNYLSFRHFERWDCTSQQIYSLSERTLAELRGLERPVHVYLFMGRDEPTFPELEELLERYRSESSKLTVEHVDPHADPARYRQLARRFEIRTSVDEAGAAEADVAAVITSGERRTTIERTDLLSADFDVPEGDSAKVDVRAERALTGAIVQLAQGEPTRVCVSRGHREWSLDGFDARSLGAAAEHLERDLLELVAVETTSEIDPACRALFVIGPETAFTPPEVERVRAYLDGGGSLFVALDVVVDRQRMVPSGLEDLLADYGIRITESVVWEENPARLIAGGHPVGPFLIASYGPHATTGPLVTAEAPSVFLEARAIEAMEGTQASPLLFTSELSWGETDIRSMIEQNEARASEDDLRGPVSIAVASELPERAEGGGGRIVVIGDTDWLTPDVLRSPSYLNEDLLRIFTGWLTKRDTLIAIAPKQIDVEPMLITEQELGFGVFGLGLRLLVLMPAAFILLGLSMWWSRRT